MMGCRKLYELVRPPDMGRDRFEALLLCHGYRVAYPKPFIRTTQAVQGVYYPNLIEGLEIRDINRVWQSDFTYIVLLAAPYYLVTILDVYSRRIIGWQLAAHMQAESNLRALQQALTLREQADLSGLIHHSDRGGQYLERQYVSLLEGRGIRISMCLQAWQNGYVERSHRSLKYEYLYAWKPKDERQLFADVERAIHNYNHGRPHNSLPGHRTPVGFEEMIQAMPAEQRPVLKLFSEQEYLQASAVY